jgi:gamma-glutamylcyclotransferase (GGCT)/AIG2-like uncharacterized protein YtfP
MHRLFTYGTLKRGFRNAFYLREARFLGEFTTDPVYSMYDFGNYPAVSESGRTAIQGEVYEINDAQLASTDRLEWYPEFYQRVMIETSFGTAWMYLVPEQLCVGKIEIGGNWL